MKSYVTRFAFTALATVACALPGLAAANENSDNGTDQGCQSLPNYLALKAALVQAVATETSGLNNHMWGTIVDRTGVVCAVAYSGATVGSQWLGSRVISAQKANTANDFSLDASAASAGSAEPGALHREPLLGGSAGWQLCSGCRRAILSILRWPTRLRPPTMGRRRIRWSATESAA